MSNTIYYFNDMNWECKYIDEINCCAINYVFGLFPPVSFGGGKRDGKLLQKLFYLSPTITKLQPNTAVCIHSAVCNLHSHMRELHINSHIPTYMFRDYSQFKGDEL